MTEADTASDQTIKQEELPEFFLKEKPCLALVKIAEKSQSDYADEKAYSSVISKEIETTYAHTVKVIKKLEESGLIESEKKGRKKYLTPTKQGSEIALRVSKLVNTIKEVDLDE